jgi:hypothetical protein
MHLMHFSTNAHSSVGSPSNANNDTNDPSENNPVTAHSPVPSRESHSPGSFGHQQPRSLPAPHSAQDPAPQHHHHYHHGMISYAKPPSNEPSQLPTPRSSVQQGRF